MSINSQSIQISEIYEILEWDSGFFGFPVVRINDCSYLKANYLSLISHFKKEGIKLAYLSIDSESTGSVDISSTLGCFKANVKITYNINLPNALYKNDQYGNSIIKYNKKIPLNELEDLSIQCSKYSRFAKDPRIPKHKCNELYKIWIRKSIQKKIAKEVLVSIENNYVSGFISLGKERSCGFIRLLVVDEASRGRGVGKSLIQHALNWCTKQKCSKCQVVTLKDNTAAQALYKKCGFEMERTEDVYHIWVP